MINYLSLFSGIGAFEKAMKNLNIPFNLVGFSEIDKYATKSYCAIHNVSESLNLGDITKIDERQLPKVDFITYGFPCQDISLAGKQQGLFNNDGTKTRSGLFFDALRIIEHTQPLVAIAENVKNLTSKKFNAQFQVVLESLESVGYNNYWAVLNAKDYGIPQNRERVFIVSIRKDVDTNIFEFPESYPLKLRLKDMLEDEVDEKFYLSNNNLKWLSEHNENHTKKGTGFKFKPKNPETDCASTIRANASFCPTDNAVEVKEAHCIQVADLNHYQNDQMNRVYSSKGISPTVLTKTSGGREIKILDEKPDVEAYTIIGGMQKNQAIKNDGICTTLTSSMGTGGGYVPMHNCTTDSRIRKLTPKECFRLMGFKDEDFEKAEQVNSNTQLYKQAGNSIVVDVAEELLCMLFDEDGKFFI